MRRNNNDRSSEVPWGWVLVSAYCSALLCVGISQIAGPRAIITFVRDYQTLLAGVATVAALLIAAQQLKRQNRRDAVDAVRHYEHEIETMRGLRAEVIRIARSTSGLTYMFGEVGEPIKLDKPYWNGLAQHSNALVAPSVLAVLDAVEDYNRLFDVGLGFAGTLSRGDPKQANEARSDLHAACSTLLDRIDRRRQEVIELIEATS